MNVELLKVEYLLSNANLFFNHSLNITSKKKKKKEEKHNQLVKTTAF